ncbi:calcium-activated chloride channel regulator 1-like [Branchiostoma floridae]|uniref:Calcium-activated chloride channel regulator 1-like n=1 Tax=Branchiostoma floridae TaxID=7739 RepID=A0A9J7N794_BRAFL|nr:calcium-activated chloride channel regulator 1-like [Branchiostoma floridae]
MAPLSVLVVSLVLAGVDSALNRPFEIVLENNEYRGVLVAISPAVPEDPRIVARLQEILTETSQAMYDATERRAYLKNITILIPKSWTPQPEYRTARTELFQRANIRVDQLNPLYGDSPYVKQKSGCGEGGDYIHLTPDYVINKQYGEAVWGPYGKTMVHEWGHLRWGLFDEYGMDSPTGESFPYFYSSVSDGVQATRCSAHLTGTHINMLTGRPCQIDPNTGLPEPACRFAPHLNSNNPATGSYMFMQFLEKVASFCHSDPSGDHTSLHNHEAPNKHNVQCGGRSAWDVMADHPDFSHGANPPRQVVSTQPDFTLIQEVDKRMVLVLDSSGSMRGERIQKLNQVAQHFIRNTVADGSWLGIVDFSTRATTAHALIQVSDDSARDQLAAAVPNSTLGWTCIGCGLLEGIQVLEANGRNAAGGILLVISDGEENQHPNITEAMPTVLDKGVIVDTIAYSDAADANLESLAARTGGMAFFYPEGDNSTALNDAFTATVAARASEEDNSPIQLISEAYALSPGETHSNLLYMDSSVGANTTFNFLWQDGTAPEVAIKDPDGNVISQGMQQYHVISSMKTVQIRVPGVAKAGKWHYNVTNDGPEAQKITVEVTSRAVSMDTPPITVSAQVGSSDVNYTDTEPTYLAVYASVSRGYVPVLGARVEAVVVRPTGDTHQITLLDDGTGADVTKHDGVYSGYFLAFSADGRYSVSVRVDDGNGQAEIVAVSGQLGGTAGGALPIDPAANLNVTVERQKTDQFQRITQGGVFALKGYPRVIPGGGLSDITPPSRITDLRVTSVSFENSTVTLSWTAVGDDFNVNGPAAKYDLRYSRSFLTSFPDASNVTADMLAQGDPLSPRHPGQVEAYVIRMPERGENVTYVFAVRACDSDGNCAGESNKVSASLAYIPPLTTTSQPTSVSSSVPKMTSPGKEETTSTTFDSSPKPAGQSQDTTTTWVIVGSAVGGVAVLGAAVFILYRGLGKASIRKVDITASTTHGAAARPPTAGTTTQATANPAFHPDV